MSDKNDPQNPPKPAGQIKARVLVAVTIGGALVQPDDVVTVDKVTLDAQAGVLDASPAAVKYAEGLKRKAQD